jgi:hypothetical protein
MEIMQNSHHQTNEYTKCGTSIRWIMYSAMKRKEVLMHDLGMNLSYLVLHEKKPDPKVPMLYDSIYV